MSQDYSHNVFDTDKLQGLHPKKHLELLNVIDRLRAQGLNEHVDLPQLIVCGDQSSGKSSVLAAISGVPFPKKENLCTRFATEVVLRRDDNLTDNRVSVSITPSSTRASTDRNKIESFHRDLSSMDQLPETMDDAASVMGLGSIGSAFSADILRLEVKGPQMPQLTIVDLPGLIHSENKFQSAEDIALVTKLVGDYMSQERSIILAVISAKNDYANQIVLSKARKVDPDGHRTLGLITKPDTLHPGSVNETTFISLARNQDVKFTLGWHVVRNQDSNETAVLERDETEVQFFEKSRWSALNPSQRGIHSLRERLSEVLFEQIRKELPGLITEITDATADAKAELTRMGRSRSTATEKQLFVVELGQKYRDLCYASCEGIYDDAFLAEHETEDASPRRFRALISNGYLEFAKKMSAIPLRVVGTSFLAKTRADVDINTLNVEVVKRAKVLLHSYRGKELPGTYNPLLIGQLFRELSQPWMSVTRELIEKTWLNARTTVLAILDEVAEESVRDACMDLTIDSQLQAMKKTLDQRLDDYMQEFKRHPITYNHYLIETVQNLRNSRRRWEISRQCQELFKSRDRVSRSDMDLVVSAMTSTNELDMDETAAQDLADYAHAFYNVALKRVVDEVPAHVIEPAVLSQLPNLLAPKILLEMSTDKIEQIGGESAAKSAYRELLQRKLDILDRSSLICKLYAERGPVPIPSLSIDNLQDNLSEDGSSIDRIVAEDYPEDGEYQGVVDEDVHGGTFGSGESAITLRDLKKLKKKKWSAAEPVEVKWDVPVAVEEKY